LPSPNTYRPALERLEERSLLAAGYGVVNLASDMPGLARVTDPNLVNPWGISFSPTGPFWFADNGSGVSDLLDGRGQAVPLVVGVPPAAGRSGTPTGTVFNGGPGFVVAANGTAAPGRFLFATADGTISAWTALVDPAHAVLAVDNSSAGAAYLGLALAADSTGQSFLYAANLARGRIDVFDDHFHSVVRPGAFQDPNLPAGFAPFNVENVDGLLFVTYARVAPAEGKNAANGFIDVYDPVGTLRQRFASGGPLAAPWGLALAPAGFGRFGGALLVGNEEDGQVNAYDLASGTLLGSLTDDHGVPLAVPGLWDLAFGNDHAAGASDTLFFTAGIDNGSHGLFGAIQAPERRGADTGGAGTFDPNDPREPKDYPLPPRDGPALKADGEAGALPGGVLLPLTESSLALVPTLAIVSQPAGQGGAPGPAAAVVAAVWNRAAAATLLSSGTTAVVLAGDDPQPPGGRTDGAAGLNRFLDLDPSQSPPDKRLIVGQPNAGRVSVGPDEGLETSREVRNEVSQAGPRRESWDAQPGGVRAAEVAPPLSPADEDRAPAEAKLETTAVPDGDEGVRNREKAAWVGWLRNLLVLGSIPAVWGWRWGRGNGPRLSPARIRTQGLP
jgi:uncharacterized protein (TIGR03118 family)